MDDAVLKKNSHETQLFIEPEPNHQIYKPKVVVQLCYLSLSLISIITHEIPSEVVKQN